MTETKLKVDRYGELIGVINTLSEELDELKAYFEVIALDKLKDTKKKTVVYWGSNNAKVSVTRSETVKLVSNDILKKLFGDIYKDYVKAETKYNMTAPCKYILGSAFQDECLEGNVEEIIQKVTVDEKERAALRKKLKSNYDTNRKYLKTLTDLSEEDANDWAYLATELYNRAELERVLKLANWNNGADKAIEEIKKAVIVDEGMKVGFSFEE